MGNTIKESAFNVIGIKVRTSNILEQSGDRRMFNLWQKFLSNNILSKIPNKTDENKIIVVYSNYEKNYKGEFDYLIGARVNLLDDIPDDLISIRVPEQKYNKFTTDTGPIAQVLFQEWSKIWNLEDEDKLNRAYNIDYEIHDSRAINPESAQVDIYVGIF